MRAGRLGSLALAAALGASLFATQPARAHLMEDQKGTLNFVGTGAFLVISLPVSGFSGIDDDGDARLSSAELRAHWKAVEDQVKASVRLSDAQGPRPLEGVILDIAPPHEKADEPATHIVALGRFSLADEKTPLTLRIELWGKAPGERSVEMGVTRNGAKRFVDFDPAHSESSL